MEIRRFTQGDTLVPLTAILKDGAGALVDLTNQDVIFVMEDVFTKANKINGKAAQITDAVNGEVQYNWEDEDVDTPGTYWGWFIRRMVMGNSALPQVKPATHPVGKQLQIIFEESPLSNVADTGAIQLNVVAAQGTYSRLSGSFFTDGFAVGMPVTFSGFSESGNNGVKVIGAITALALTVTDVAGLVDETGSGDERGVAS